MGGNSKGSICSVNKYLNRKSKKKNFKFFRFPNIHDNEPEHPRNLNATVKKYGKRVFLHLLYF